MYILGISCYYHDSAACLLKDEKVLAAAEEERFSRQKHDNSFPENAVDYCLDEAGIESERLNYVVFYEKPVKKFERILQTFTETFPHGFRYFYSSIPEWINKKLRIRSEIRDKLDFDVDILFNRHHLSHAAAAFLVSPFDEAAVLTVDGVGEWTTTQISKGEKNKIEPLKKIDFPHSLGLLYSTVTSYLGFMVNNDEYKVMGLAPYGEPKYYEKFKENIIEVKEDGSFKLNMDYFSFRESERMWSDELKEEFGNPREPEGGIKQRHKDIAASLQKVIEEVMLKLTQEAHRITGCENLCMSGGVVLNSASNGRLRKKSPFEKIWVQPASTDAGGAMGAALYLYNHILENEKRYKMDNIYLGPEFRQSEIKSVLEKNEAKFERMNRESLINKAARLLKNYEIVSLFQGRMEWGPRALGNRSIIANPRRQETMDIINRKVKHREEFRPFAPAVLEDEASEYFEVDYRSPYMTFVFDVKKNKKNEIPAVTHVDGTSRIETVRRERNPFYYDLISKFGKLTGTPLVLNTSFNIKGEPIVCTPEDAYSCFSNTGIDYMIAENFLIKE